MKVKLNEIIVECNRARQGSDSIYSTEHMPYWISPTPCTDIHLCNIERHSCKKVLLNVAGALFSSSKCIVGAVGCAELYNEYIDGNGL